MPMDERTATYYEKHALAVAGRYESVQSPVEGYFAAAFTPGSRVLDIGCGSGRDLARLIALGYDAYGVEPSAGLRAQAIERHPELSGKIHEGQLPDPGTPFGGEFDAILCCAVLMHLSAGDLGEAATRMRGLLKQHGRLLVSLPLSRGEMLRDDRDADGRLFAPYSPDEIARLFERRGFRQINRWDRADALGRSGTSWYTLLFALGDPEVANP